MTRLSDKRMCRGREFQLLGEYTQKVVVVAVVVAVVVVAVVAVVAVAVAVVAVAVMVVVVVVVVVVCKTNKQKCGYRQLHLSLIHI